MKVKELIKKLKKTKSDNEVRITSHKGEYYTKNLYVSYDDVGDVVIYEV